jgi:hypothetical protein
VTVDDVDAEVRRIASMASDPEAAHSIEDDLYVRVLEAIVAWGCDHDAALAAAALKTQDFNFARWCA